MPITLNKLPLNDRDRAWVDAMRRYMGDGTGCVPIYRNPDGTVNANATIDRLMQMYDIKPKIPAPLERRK